MYYKKLFKKILIICITCPILINNSTICAKELNDEALSNEASKIINSANFSFDIISKQSNNIHIDKEYSEEYLNWLNLSDEEKEKYGDVIPNEEFIKIDLKNENLYTKNIDISSKKANVLAKTNEIPSEFLIKNVKVESQEDSGWCWAYSSLKCLETYLKKNKNLEYNLAEYHLAYMKYKEFGGWNNSLEENTEYTDYGEQVYKNGGNFDDFMKYVGIYSKEFAIKGPVLGSDDENIRYSLNNENKTNFLAKVPIIKVNKTVQFGSISKKYDMTGNAKYYNGNNEVTSNQLAGLRNSVKEHIINNGGVFSIINMNMSDYNSNTYSLYTNSNDIQNSHAVTIIGWDDNYLASNFNYGKRPQKNGAWIALNSWGEDFGENGLFYISYDDAIVEKFLCGVVEAEEYNCIPKVQIAYDNSEKNKVKVTITSNERLQKPDNSWIVTYDEYYNTQYSKIRTTATKLEKTYYTNVKNEIITLKDNSNSKVDIKINIDSIIEYKLGDINTDNYINITDLIFLKRHIIAGERKNWLLSDEKIKYADINNDGKINVTDLLMLKKILLKN